MSFQQCPICLEDFQIKDLVNLHNFDLDDPKVLEKMNEEGINKDLNHFACKACFDNLEKSYEVDGVLHFPSGCPLCRQQMTAPSYLEWNPDLMPSSEPKENKRRKIRSRSLKTKHPFSKSKKSINIDEINNKLKKNCCSKTGEKFGDLCEKVTCGMTRLGFGGNRKTRKRKSRRKRKKNTRRKKSAGWQKQFKPPSSGLRNRQQAEEQAQQAEEQAQQQAQQQLQYIQRKNELIRSLGSYRVRGNDFWQGDMTMESWNEEPCCSNCESYGCMSYLSERCGTYKCAPCDENLLPRTGRKRRCDPVRRRGGKRKSRRNKKTRKKRKTKRKIKRNTRKK